jgi:hypothetical protein
MAHLPREINRCLLAPRLVRALRSSCIQPSLICSTRLTLALRAQYVDGLWHSLADGDERSREATCDKRLIYFSSHFMFFTKQFSSSMATNDAQAGTVIPGLFVSPLPVETPSRSIAGPWSYSPISRGFERARLAGTPFLFCFFARSTRVVGSCESTRCSLAGARVTLPVHLVEKIKFFCGRQRASALVPCSSQASYSPARRSPPPRLGHAPRFKA